MSNMVVVRPHLDGGDEEGRRRRPAADVTLACMVDRDGEQALIEIPGGAERTAPNAPNRLPAHRGVARAPHGGRNAQAVDGGTSFGSWGSRRSRSLVGGQR